MDWTRTVTVGAMLAATIGFASPAAAHGADVTAGYQFERVGCSDCDSTTLPLGFSVDVAGELNEIWSWVGQVDWSRKSEDDFTDTLTSFDFGTRWAQMQPNGMSPFLQVLVGATRHGSSFEDEDFDSETNFNFEIDGGVAVPVSADKRTSIVGEVGYRRVTGDLGLNVIRLVIGARFHLGE